MSNSRKPLINRLRPLLPITGQNSICASNSVLPLIAVTNSQHETDTSNDDLSVVVVSPKVESSSSSGIIEVEPPKIEYSSNTQHQHPLTELPEVDSSSERSCTREKDKARVAPENKRIAGQNVFLISSSPANEGDGSSSAEICEPSRNKPSQYLQVYYEVMYYTGFCTYRTGKNLSGKKPIWIVFAEYSQRAIFWSVALFSAFQSLCLSKFFLLNFMEEKEYYAGVSFGHHFACLVAKMYAINLFAFKKQKTDKMLREMEDYENCADIGTSSSWKRKFVVLLLISSVAFAISQPFANNDNDDVEGLIVDSCHEFIGDLFLWHSKNMTDAVDRLEKSYGKSMSPTTIAFGTIVITRDMSSYMILGIMLDLVMIVAVVMYIYVKAFIKDVKAVTANVPREHVNEWTQLQARREAVWKKYRRLRAVVRAVNDVFDPLLKLMHGGNLLMFAFFMALCVFSTLSWAALILYARDLVKVEVGYYIAGRIAEANEVIRAWLRNWALYTGKIRVGNETLDINVVLDELKSEPIGLGKGNFLIHHTFHFKFLGLVGSVFFSMADEEKNA